MVTREVKIINKQGLHMRPASEFAKKMSGYDAEVTLIYNGNRINGKSVMLLIAACIKCGAQLTVECSGPDEQEALKCAVEMVETGFGE